MKDNSNIFSNYNKCTFCGGKNFVLEKNQFNSKNFYVDAIISDLRISKKLFKKIKTFKCKNCYIIQNNPWFSKEISRKIYSEIYGQHNRGWSNLLKFMNKGVLPNHGKLFNLLTNNIKIKNYAEFNSPFMGVLINFFSKEYKQSTLFYKNLKKNLINYFISRQVAGRSKEFQKSSFKKSKRFLKNVDNLKRINLKKKGVKKYLFVDNSNLCWGQNDNYMSVNSKSFASKMLDLKIIDLKFNKPNLKFDLFGIFHTLDHTFEPKMILNYALDVSKYVVVYCHSNEDLSKQHLFTITNSFLKYLNKNKIYTLNLTNKIEKNFNSPEIYFICSRNKNSIKKLEQKV